MPYVIVDRHNPVCSGVRLTNPLSLLRQLTSTETRWLHAAALCAEKYPTPGWLSAGAPEVFADKTQAERALAELQLQMAALMSAMHVGPDAVAALLGAHNTTLESSLLNRDVKEAVAEQFVIEEVNTLPDTTALTSWCVACEYPDFGLQYLLSPPDLGDPAWVDSMTDQVWRSRFRKEAVEKAKSLTRVGGVYAFPLPCPSPDEGRKSD